MTVTPGVVLGARLGPFAGRLDADLVRRYADATRDPNASSRRGDVVPPVAVVTQIWEAQQAAFSTLVPPEVRASMTSGVHGEHDVVVHRPIVPGEDLTTWVEGHGCRRGGRHALVTMRYATFGSDGEPVAEQWWTTVLLDAVGDPVGDAAPDHAVASDGRGHPVADYGINVDDDMARRYAEASGDWSAHHFDVDAARRSGFDRCFLHGLCTMALCTQGAVALLADGDAGRVRRVAVRFASPVFVGDDLEVHFSRAGDRTYVFEADSNGVAVIRNGLVELRA